jgi:PAS domain S-box-containing protein
LLERREKGTTEKQDFVFRRRDGTEIWTLVSTNPIYNGKGEFIGGLAMIVDVSDRHRAEAALRESELRNRALINAIPDSMFLQDKNFVYLDYHSNEPQKLRVSPHDFLGRDMREVLPSEYCVQAVPLFNKVLKTGRPQTFDYHRLIDGEQHSFEVRMVRCGTDMVLTIVRDITEQRRSAEALRESEENLAAAQAITHLGSWEVDAASAEDLRTAKPRWSAEMYRIFGLEPGDVENVSELYENWIDSEDLTKIQGLPKRWPTEIRCPWTSE